MAAPADSNAAAVPAGLEPLRRPTREEAMEAVRTLIAWAGDDPTREGLLDTPVRVQARGGQLTITWNAAEPGAHVFMTGPAVTVFEGEVEIPT